MRRCYLVRHGQTSWNRENRIQGHSDIPLDEIGLSQAQRVGAAFAEMPVRALFTSWLARSQQTAQAIAQAHPKTLEPVIERDLAEIHLGDWEGLTMETLEQRFPRDFADWQTFPSRVVIPNAEPLAAFKQRVRVAFASLSERLPAGDSVVVAHGGVIAALLAEFLEADFDRLLRNLRLDNGGITAVEWLGGQPHVLWINSVRHLTAEGKSP